MARLLFLTIPAKRINTSARSMTAPTVDR